MNEQSLLFVQKYFYIILPLAIIDIILKGVAMWRASQQKNKNWFVALFLLNTLGILPILYLAFFSKKNNA